MTSQPERGPTQRLRHRERSNNRRGGRPSLPVTRGDIQHVGGDQLGWWHQVGANADVRALRGYASEKAQPGEVRASSFQGDGVMNMHPPYQPGENVAGLSVTSGKTSRFLIDGDFIRVNDGVVEGGCGFSLDSSTAGVTYSQAVSLQPSLVYVPAGVIFSNVDSTNCTAAAVSIGNNKFVLNVTSTAGGALHYFADFATLSSTTPPPPPPPGTGPVFGIDRIANQTHNPSEYPDFIICRRSMGSSHDSDAYAAAVLAEATGAGKLTLFYHYGIYGGTAEADVFTAAVGRTVGAGNEKNYGMAFDWEDRRTSQAAVQNFMNRVRTNTGGLCGLYTFWYFLHGGYPYGIGQDWNWVSYVVHPNKPPPGPYDIWQYNVKYEGGFGIDQDRSEMSKADLLARVT